MYFNRTIVCQRLQQLKQLASLREGEMGSRRRRPHSEGRVGLIRRDSD